MYQCPLTGQICFNQKPITTYKIINGVLTQLNICDQCAGHMNFQQGVDPYTAVWRQFLITIFHLLQIDRVLPPEQLQHAIMTIKNKEELNLFLEELAARKRAIEEVEPPPCPTCGATIRGILSSGRMGCANCYVHFNDFIQTVLVRAQDGNIKHTGKVPKSEDTVEDIEQEMAVAVKEERYEDAAKLRDKIKAIKEIPPSI